MKKLAIALMFGIGVSFTTYAQDAQEISTNEVPQTIQNNFNNRFGQASDIEWKQKENAYMAKFEVNDVDHYAKYDANGNLEKHGHEIPVSQLPQAVTNAISQQYSDYEIDDAGRVEQDGQTMYKVKLDRDDDKDRKMLFSSDGRLVKDRMKDDD